MHPIMVHAGGDGADLRRRSFLGDLVGSGVAVDGADWGEWRQVETRGGDSL